MNRVIQNEEQGSTLKIQNVVRLRTKNMYHIAATCWLLFGLTNVLLLRTDSNVLSWYTQVYSARENRFMKPNKTNATMIFKSLPMHSSSSTPTSSTTRKHISMTVQVQDLTRMVSSSSKG